jgi:putative ribosome biogenesis GTPase RsgA
MGYSGVGKSTFIDYLTGENKKREKQNSKESTTKICEKIKIKLGGKEYFIMDTPGLLNDTNGLDSVEEIIN